MLRRLLAYGRTVLKWETALEAVSDRRRRGWIPTHRIVRATAAMFLARIGSLNALAQTRGGRFWAGWLGGPLPSADTIGRVAALMDPSGLRALLHQEYERLKRGKALDPPAHGLMAGVLDGHESHATFHRCCAGCLTRTIHTARGDRTQYYHRYVAFHLVGRDLEVMLDLEEVRPGEDEVATAVRLLDRVLADYPRAFDVVVGDGMYADPRVFNWAIDHGKDALAVLKEDHPALLADARSLMATIPPTVMEEGTRRRECWDLEGFTTWETVKAPVRIVRTRETQPVRRQLDGRVDPQESEWFWGTTLRQRLAPTRVVVTIGHRRWAIENEGFNELVNHWYADHVYRHHPTALLVFWLLAFACLNLFAAFYRRNLKPAARRAFTRLHIARLAAAELYQGLLPGPPRTPI